MTAESPGLDAEGETDRLYELSPEGFVEGRNALAARLKSAGDKDGAARVKALVRPSVSAWAANQVYWKARPEFDLLLASVGRLRHAQLAGSAGGSAIRDAMKARREAMDAVLRRAETLLTSAGLAAGPDTLQRVSNTLEALASEGARPTGVRPGRLARDLEPPGFDAFAMMAAAQPSSSRGIAEPAPPSIAPSAAPASGSTQAAAEPVPPAEQQHAEERARLQALLAEAESRLERARQEAREAAGALSVAEKRAEAARAELDEATRRLARAQERATLTAEDQAVARQKAERLAAARESAESARDALLRAQRDVEPD